MPALLERWHLVLQLTSCLCHDHHDCCGCRCAAVAIAALTPGGSPTVSCAAAFVVASFGTSALHSVAVEDCAPDLGVPGEH